MDMDFGYNSGDNVVDYNTANVNNNNDDSTNLDTGKIVHDTNGVTADDVNDVSDVNNGNVEQVDTKTDSDNTLVAGTSIEVGDDTYTVDDKGNLIDKDGNVFKESKDVKSWLEEFDKVDETDDSIISISDIQDALGVEITDDNNKPIEYDNTKEGIKAYVEAVIETSKQEHFEAAINTLYQKYPILSDVLNYYIANGNSLNGFGQIPDRSNIVIDDANETQQEAIIRAAWEEQGRKGDITGYINYLKASGTLLATAREELQSLQEADKSYREQLAKEAEETERKNAEMLQNYWNGVHNIVKSRNIAGYRIPENIIINRDGQKLSATPEDFFNYIYRVDQNGKSAYEKDLAKETPESRRDDEILRAYLKFVGGNYSNLVDMAINKEKVDTLKLRAKERNKTTVRINKPKVNSTKGTDIDLGYN